MKTRILAKVTQANAGLPRSGHADTLDLEAVPRSSSDWCHTSTAAHVEGAMHAPFLEPTQEKPCLLQACPHKPQVSLNIHPSFGVEKNSGCTRRVVVQSPFDLECDLVSPAFSPGQASQNDHLRGIPTNTSKHPLLRTLDHSPTLGLEKRLPTPLMALSSCGKTTQIGSNETHTWT